MNSAVLINIVRLLALTVLTNAAYVNHGVQSLLIREEGSESTDLASLLELNDDQWVGFLSRAGTANFEGFVDYIRRLLGLDGDCEEEEGDDHDNDGGDGADDDDVDVDDDINCLAGDDECPEMDYTSAEPTATPVPELSSELIWGNSESAPAFTLASIMNRVQKYTASSDVEQVLSAAGNFQPLAPSSNATSLASEKLTSNMTLSSEQQVWLKQTAQRRAAIIEKALTEADKFNRTSIFEAEEFQYRQGNIFLDEDDNDEENTGSATSVLPLMYAIVVASFLI